MGLQGFRKTPIVPKTRRFCDRFALSLRSLHARGGYCHCERSSQAGRSEHLCQKDLRRVPEVTIPTLHPSPTMSHDGNEHRWRITLFGGMAVQNGSVRLTRFETRKVDALLACLALRFPEPVPRELLGEMLWPDEEWSAVRSRLRQALSSLRQDLLAHGAPPDLLNTERDAVRLHPEAVGVDVAEFSSALARARLAADPSETVSSLREAICLYQAPLLPGWYDEWVVRQRERFAHQWQDAALRLGGLLEAHGDLEGAAELTCKLLEEDPLREDACLLLMRCYAATGRGSEALRRFKELERALKEDLAAVPSEEARALYEQVRTGRFQPAVGSRQGAEGEKERRGEGDPESPPRPLARSPRPESRPSTIDHHRSTSIEPDGGAVPLDSEFYIERPVNQEFAAALARQDSIVLVKGARQIGKTSLLARGLQQAREGGFRVALTDLQKLTSEQLQSADTLLLTLARAISDELDLDAPVDELWKPHFGWNVNFERFLRRTVLSQLKEPLVWGLDEVDRLFGYPFCTEVFGLFRSWHNERSLNPDGPWGRLTIVIAYATEAHLFITNLNQSPFNVGTRLALEDFTPEEVAELNRRYGQPLRTDDDRVRFYSLLNGHPYLSRRGLSAMTAQRRDMDWLEADALREDGLFSDPLRRMLDALRRDPELCDAVRSALRGGGCSPDSFYRLRSAGIMIGDAAAPQPRCRLLADFLQRRLL